MTVETHNIQVGPSPWDDDLLAWACSCSTISADSFGEIGYAVGVAVKHVPAGHTWLVRPTDKVVSL